MTRQIKATPDQVLAVYGGLLGGVFVMGAWWAAWWFSGGRRGKRLVKCACGLVTRGRAVAHPPIPSQRSALDDSIARHPAGKGLGR